MSTNLIHGPFSLEICFLTMVSKAMSGVKRPLLHTDREGQRARKQITKMSLQEKIQALKYRHFTFSLNYARGRFTTPDTVNVPDGIVDLLPQLHLIRLHLRINTSPSVLMALFLSIVSFVAKRDVMALSIMQNCRDKSVWM